MSVVLQPPGWAPAKGYSNGILTSGQQIYLAGQIGWNAQCEFESDSMVEQIRQALSNVVEILRLADGKPADIVRMTWYVTDKREYLKYSKEIGTVYREIMGNHYPAMSLIPVSELLEDKAKVEIEATAVLDS